MESRTPVRLPGTPGTPGDLETPDRAESAAERSVRESLREKFRYVRNMADQLRGDKSEYIAMLDRQSKRLNEAVQEITMLENIQMELNEKLEDATGDQAVTDSAIIDLKNESTRLRKQLRQREIEADALREEIEGLMAGEQLRKEKKEETLKYLKIARNTILEHEGEMRQVIDERDEAVSDVERKLTQAMSQLKMGADMLEQTQNKLDETKTMLDETNAKLKEQKQMTTALRKEKDKCKSSLASMTPIMKNMFVYLFNKRLFKTKRDWNANNVDAYFLDLVKKRHIFSRDFASIKNKANARGDTSDKYNVSFQLTEKEVLDAYEVVKPQVKTVKASTTIPRTIRTGRGGGRGGGRGRSRRRRPALRTVSGNTEGGGMSFCPLNVPMHGRMIHLSHPSIQHKCTCARTSIRI